MDILVANISTKTFVNLKIEATFALKLEMTVNRLLLLKCLEKRVNQEHWIFIYKSDGSAPVTLFQRLLRRMTSDLKNIKE
jgi:hypothetical protein